MAFKTSENHPSYLHFPHDPLKVRGTVDPASGQGRIVDGSIDGVNEAIDSTTNTTAIPVGDQ
jgi:hypothetical protein